MPANGVGLISHPHSRPTCWINKLPNELLTTILLNAAKMAGSIRDRHYFPFTTLLVCRRWQAISTNTRALWTCLCVQPSPSPTTIIEYLGRSGFLPLEIQVATTKKNMVLYETRWLQWREIFLQIAPRVQVIHLDVTHATLDDVSDSLLELSQEFPGVLELTASPDRKGRADGRRARSSWNANLHLPQVRSLQLKDCTLDSWKDIARSCASIEELSIVEHEALLLPVMLGEFVEVLRASPNLRSLELGSQVIQVRSTYEEIYPVVLENLESLVVRNYEHRAHIMLFSFIKAPQLKRLKISGQSGCEHSFYLPTPSLDFPSLETLEINQSRAALKMAMLFSPFARHIKLYQRDADPLLDNLRSYWARVSSPLPLQTLTTEGVSLVALSRLSRINVLLPSLREVIALEEGRVWRFQSLGSSVVERDD